MPPIARTGVAWAVLSAYGIAYVATGIALAVLQLALRPLREIEMALTNRTIYVADIPESIVYAISFALGALGGAFVGRRAGGLAATALYFATLAIPAAMLVVSAFGREQQLRSEPCCTVLTVSDVPLGAAATFVLPAIAFAVGAVTARVRATRGSTNALAESAGAYAFVGVLAAAAIFAFPVYAVAYAPYATVGMDAVPHAAVLFAQSTIAGAVCALRGGAVHARTVAAFALMGLAGVAFADVLPIYNTLFLDWTYVPVSLIVVPLISAVIGTATVFGLNLFMVAGQGAPAAG